MYKVETHSQGNRLVVNPNKCRIWHVLQNLSYFSADATYFIYSIAFCK